MNDPRSAFPAAFGRSAKVGRAVRFWRRRRGLVPSELARRAGLGEDQLAELEAGLIDPGLDQLDAIARVLEIKLVALFDENER